MLPIKLNLNKLVVAGSPEAPPEAHATPEIYSMKSSDKPIKDTMIILPEKHHFDLLYLPHNIFQGNT